jgi:hypothetical protein
MKSLPVPEFIDPVFRKTSPKRSFSLNRKRAYWLVFAKTGSIISGTVQSGPIQYVQLYMMPVPEFIDPVLGMKMIVFVKIRPKRSYSIQSVPRDAVSACFG